MSLRAANVALHVLHVAVIVFATFGWAWPAARPWHLALAACIATSWFVVGPCRGEVGYCVLTGAQHAVWRRLHPGRPRPGYVSLLVERLVRRPVAPRRVALWTQAVFYATTALSAGLACTEPAQSPPLTIDPGPTAREGGTARSGGDRAGAVSPLR